MAFRQAERMLVRGADNEKHNLSTDEDRWQAVLARDPRADNQFVFAVQTTGILVVVLSRPPRAA
ncbi:Ada metal-binding domain-containing protein [Enterobacter hormaechei]